MRLNVNIFWYVFLKWVENVEKTIHASQVETFKYIELKLHHRVFFYVNNETSQETMIIFF